MWEIVLFGQVVDLPLSLLWGVSLAALYDVLRAWRRVWPRGAFRLALEDIAFGLLAAYAAFPLFLVRCNGEIRGYLLAALFGGFCLWHVTVSKWWVRCLTALLRTLRRLAAVGIGLWQKGERSFVRFLGKIVEFGRRIRKIFRFSAKKSLKPQG